MVRRAYWVAVCVACLTPIGAHAKDLTVHQRITSAPSATARDEMLYWSDTKRVTDDMRKRSIVDFEARTFTSIDKEKRTYSVRTFDELRKQSEQAREHFAKMPPEAKKLMGGMDSAVTLRPTGNTQTIAGQEAKEYLIEGGPYSGSLWAAESIDLGPKAEEWKNLAAAMSSGSGPGGRLGEALSKIKGFPLRISITTVTGGNKFTFNTEAIEITDKAAPADALTVPTGFTKIDFPRTR